MVLKIHRLLPAPLVTGAGNKNPADRRRIATTPMRLIPIPTRGNQRTSHHNREGIEPCLAR